MDIASVFVRVQLNEKIKLEPAFISKGYKDEILKRLKAKVEGICTRHGYIKPDSIEVYKIGTGRVELIGLNGNTQFDVYFFADVCNPLVGSIIKCKVSNVNKFGILAEAGNIIEAIVAKNSVSIQSEIDLDKVRIGDEVFIEVLGKKYELNDKKISLIARIVRSPDVPRRSISSVSGRKQAFQEDDEEEQEQEVRLIEGGANSEDENEDNEDDDNESDEENASDDGDGDDQEIDESNDEAEDDETSDKVGGNFFSDDDDYFKSDGEEDFENEDGGDTDGSGESDDE